MILIGVLNSKGGVGKTTLTTALSVRAARDFQRVGIVDLDPQASATRWFDLRKEKGNPTVLRGVAIASEAIEALGQTGWDVIFFDGAPGLLEITEDAAKTVDLVVIPLRSGDSNIAATEHTIAACKEFDTAFLMVINEIARENDRHAADTEQALISLGFPVAKRRLMRRVAYQTAPDVGKTGPELDGGRDVKAVEEIDELYVEVMAAARKAIKKKRGGR